MQCKHNERWTTNGIYLFYSFDFNLHIFRHSCHIIVAQSSKMEFYLFGGGVRNAEENHIQIQKVFAICAAHSNHLQLMFHVHHYFHIKWWNVFRFENSNTFWLVLSMCQDMCVYVCNILSQYALLLLTIKSGINVSNRAKCMYSSFCRNAKLMD